MRADKLLIVKEFLSALQQHDYCNRWWTVEAVVEILKHRFAHFDGIFLVLLYCTRTTRIVIINIKFGFVTIIDVASNNIVPEIVEHNASSHVYQFQLDSYIRLLLALPIYGILK
jgi:hypothetical protein